MSSVSHDRSTHRFSMDVDGQQAHLDYTLTGKIMSITHTRVPEEIGGRGVAGDLMRAAITAAAAENWNVNPICSYAVAYMRKHKLPTEQMHSGSGQ